MAPSVIRMSMMTVRGCELAYELIEDSRETSARTPFVWGHGLSSSRANENRRPLIDTRLVAEQRRVVRYDARGHGESGPLRASREGDWAELALDQIELLDQLGLGEIVLGGASMGAATALHAALRLRARVEKLVLVIPPTAWDSRRAQVDLYEQMATIVETKGVEPLIRGLTITPPPDPFVGDDIWLSNRTEALRGAEPERLAAAFRGAALANLPAPEAIETITTPALILAWSGDPGHPTSTADRLAGLLPNSDVAIASTADELSTWTGRAVAFLDQ